LLSFFGNPREFAVVMWRTETMHVVREFLSHLANSYHAHSPIWRVCIAVAGILLCLIGGQAVLNSLVANPSYPDHVVVDLYLQTDFDIYMRAAENLSANPYRPELGTGFDRYGYPPLLADVLAALKLLLGPVLLGALWPALCAASIVGAVVLLGRGFGARLGYHWIALAVGIVLIGRVVRSDIIHGQINVMVLLLLATGLLLRSQNRVIAASIAFAVMMSLKPFMGAVMIYFALRADWRMVRWGLGMGAAVFVTSFLPTLPSMIEAALGWREATQYFTSPPFVTKPDNQSAYGMLLRMFTDTPFSTPWVNNPAFIPAFMALAIALAGALAIVGLYLGKRGPDDEEARIAPAPALLLLECSMVLALAMFCGPLTEGNHMILVLAGLAGALIVGAERIKAKSAQSLLWLVAIAAWLLPALFVVFPKSLSFTYGLEVTWDDLSGLEILLSGRSAILLLFSGAATAIALWQERKTSLETAITKPPFGKRRSVAQPASDAARSH
jgi:hypothetical protein